MIRTFGSNTPSIQIETSTARATLQTLPSSVNRPQLGKTEKDRVQPEFLPTIFQTPDKRAYRTSEIGPILNVR
jgi:hypothetical protein